MSATLQSQAVQIVNQMMALGQEAYNLQQQITAVTTQYTQLTLGTVINSFPTCVVNADGSLGTADGSPNTSHVIDTRVAAVSALGRAMSASDIASLSTGLTAIGGFLSGSAASQQGQLPQLWAKLTGG